MDAVLIQLGRVGDIINILPVLEEENRNGKRQTLMVSSEFAGLLDGVSYCDVLPYVGDYSRLRPAEALARFQSKKVRTSQIWGNDYGHTRVTDCFQKDSWNRVGFLRRWEQTALIFDRRDEGRELVLSIKVLGETKKPIVLVNLGGHSAPYAKGAELLETLRRECGEDFDFVDISGVRAERVYDLLGLFDHAECLITSDTATLHLAQASSVPVISLVNPIGWLAGARRANHVVRMDYNRVNTECIKLAIYSTQYRTGKLVHVYSEYKMKEDDQRRVNVAKASWKDEYARAAWVQRPVDYDVKLPRNSRTVLGDTRSVPFVKDMIDYGFSEATDMEDLVVLTNTDVGFTPGMTDSLRRLVACKGALFAYRWDFSRRLDRPLTKHEALRGAFFGGLDLFAFSRGWWAKHRAEAPDMVLGSTHWDLVYRDLIKKHGGGELYGAIWHELHDSFWKVHPRTAGNMHNINLANLWWTTNDTTKPYRLL